MTLALSFEGSDTTLKLAAPSPVVRGRRVDLTGAAVSTLALALVTGSIYALRPVAPVLSLGVLYVFAVLPVAVWWGLAYALPVSVVSMLLFNFLFLPPEHTFALRDSENWVALAVYLVTAVVVSELAARARRRAADAERLARAAMEAETLRRSDAIKTTLLRTLSHDLRSPLTGIGAASEILESASLTPEDRSELVNSIRHETRRLTRIIGNLLDLSRLEAGAARPRSELWTADGLVVRALEALGPEAERIRTSLADSSPALEVDASQIERVLVNLLENALAVSSPADTVELETDVVAGELQIRVVDHGPGLDPRERERIFEPFERGRSSTAGGTGLGLAIARGFAQANSGRLWAESSSGGGATFVLALPVTAAVAQA